MTFMDFGINVNGHTRGQTTTTCPRCSHERRKKHVACLSVNLDEGLFNCHHCGWSGSLDTQAHTPLMRRSSAPLYHKPTPLTPNGLPPRVLEWFASRGIPAAVVERRQITYGPKYFGQLKAEANAIGFPYFRGGELINVKYRDGQKHFTMEPGAELVLYGLDDITGDTVYLVEGEIDCLTLEVAGVRSVVSVPNGAPALNTSNYERQFAFLASAEDTLKGCKRIVIAVDTDAPGLKLGDELARRLGPERCARVQWAGDCKDANEVLMSHGAAVVKECLEHATPWPVSGIITVEQLLPDLSYIYDHGMERGESTGWHALDRHYTVRPGEWTLVSGIPAHGKSTFLDALMMNLARRLGWRFAVFSPENYPLKRYTARLLETYTGKPFDGAPARMSHQEMADGAAWLDQHVSYLMPEDEEPTVDHLLDLARIQVYRHGIKGLILDPWNEIESGESAQLTETKAISKALSTVRRFAQRHDVHIWLIAHPTKMRVAEKGKYEGLYPPPTPYDTSGSAHWRNKPDNCLCVWRDVEGFKFPESLVEIHIQKIKFREIGTIGTVLLLYDKMCRRYRELTPEEYERWVA
jgi:twinkle protein